MISDEEIENAKKKTCYTLTDHSVQHNDCIRIAYEWLDAQKKIKSKIKEQYPIKHMIENWAGRSVSITDVDIASYLHKAISGEYPYYNISSKLTEPFIGRLENIGEAFKHNNYRENHNSSSYSFYEPKSFIEFLFFIKNRKKKFNGDYSCDFATDTLSDNERPLNNSKKGWLEFLKKHQAIPQAFEGFEQSWEEFRQIKKQK